MKEIFQIEGITADEFRSIIHEEIKNLSQAQPEKKEQEPKYLTIEETGIRLKSSKGTINSLANQGILKRNRIRGKVLFLTTEVDSAVRDGSATKYRRK